MVVPMELCHASYGRSVLDFLARSFRTIQLLSFRRRLFPELSQDTLLLLAHDRGDSRAEIRWRHLQDASALRSLTTARVPRARKLDAAAITGGRERLIEQFLPPRARALYAELRRNESIRRLGSLADVGIGYVTGANSFFHLSASAVTQWRIPERYLRPAVCRGRAFKGLRFTRTDWSTAFDTGDAAQLLSIPRQGAIHSLVKPYIEHGESHGVHIAYKCRTREPWYHVPHIREADAFLTYMSGIVPRFIANHSEAVAPNTLHVVRIRPLCGLTTDQLAVSWQSSLTELSTEVEGHAMGGGLLKLEPSEAERVLVALPGPDSPEDSLQGVDTLMRHGSPGIAQATVDRMILGNHIGLSRADCRILREAINVLRARRLPRAS